MMSQMMSDKNDVTHPAVSLLLLTVVPIVGLLVK